MFAARELVTCWIVVLYPLLVIELLRRGFPTREAVTAAGVICLGMAHVVDRVGGDRRGPRRGGPRKQLRG